MAAHILLIEDDPSLRYVFGKILEAAGYVVTSFPDFAGVLETLVPGAQVDLLLTDIMLRRGTPHGISLAAMVQKRRPMLPTIFMTGHREYAQFVPADAKVLIKPIGEDALLAAVASSVTPCHRQRIEGSRAAAM